MLNSWSTWDVRCLNAIMHIPDLAEIRLIAFDNKSRQLIEEMRWESLVKLGPHSTDGSYFEITLRAWKNIFKLEFESEDDRFSLRVIPVEVSPTFRIFVAGLFRWNAPGIVEHTKVDSFEMTSQDRSRNGYKITTLGIQDQSTPVNITYPGILMDGSQPFYVRCNHDDSISEMDRLFSLKQSDWFAQSVKGEGWLAEMPEAAFKGIAWNTIYEPISRRICTPVTREWCIINPERPWFGSYVIFVWDTFLASLITALQNEELAYEQIEVLLAGMVDDHLPLLTSEVNTFSERSQPPVGAYCVLKLYHQFHNLSFLKRTFDRLTAWHGWWMKHRDGNGDGLLEWGTDLEFLGDQHLPFYLNESRSESGLDNSPMYDETRFNPRTHTLEMTDVGLNSLYALDCWALAEIASELAKFDENYKPFVDELYAEFEQMRNRINQNLWNEELGIYCNRHWDGRWSTTLSPTNFYPMLAGLTSSEQSSRMVSEHLLNPDEFWGEFVLPTVSRDHPSFVDNNYWRGRIWAPTNFLVGEGLKRAGFDDVAVIFAQKSVNLFKAEWLTESHIHENYNAITGDGDDVENADPVYTWGGLLATMGISELAEAQPWGGIRFGNLSGEKGAVRNLRFYDGLYDIEMDSGLKVHRDGVLIISSDVPVLVTNYHRVEGILSFDVCSKRSAVLFIYPGQEDRLLTVNGKSHPIRKVVVLFIDGSICLNGEWRFSPLNDPHPIDCLPMDPVWEKVDFRVPSSWRWSLNIQADFQPYNLFAYPAEWNEVRAGLLQRKFYYSPSEGKRACLIFHGVFQSWSVFVNGILAGQPVCQESFLPVEVDVTDTLHQGENDITLWCGDWERIPTQTGDKVLTPNGSWFAGLARGPWQDVFLETRPAVRIEDIYVQTSVRKSCLSVQIRLENHTQSSTDGRILTQVYDGDQPVREFIESSVLMRSEEITEINLEIPWEEARFWSPESPHLYYLIVKLNSSQGEDTRLIRFGFREFWIEGENFFLNGKRINLRGDAWHYQGFVFQTPEYARNWYRVSKNAGVNFIRLHAQPYPEFFLDIADEEGMLIIDESAIYGSSKQTLSDDPRFISQCKDHLQRLVKRDRNHPSVIIWSMQNEMRWVDGREGYRESIPTLVDAMRSLDGSRPISFDGDNRLVPQDWCDIVSMHYNIDGTVASWDRSKPLIFGEHGPYHYISPQTCTDLGGSEAYLSFRHCLESIGESERLFIEYARRSDAAVTPFNLVNYSHWTIPFQDEFLSWERLDTPGPKPKKIPAHSLTINNGLSQGELSIPNPALAPVQKAFKPVTIIPDELDTNFYSGSVPRSYTIFNDTENSTDVHINWSLVNKEQKIDGRFDFIQNPGEKVPWKHTFDFVPGKNTLVVRLFHEDELKDERSQVYSVYSPEICQRAIHVDQKRVVYVGSQGGYQKLSRMIPGLHHSTNIQSALMEPCQVLIIGSFSSNLGDVQAYLGEFVACGGVLLVLEQDQFTLGDLSLSGRKYFTTHAVDPQHPILEGLTSEDLRFWYPDNPNEPTWRGLVRNAFIKPSQGDLAILLECGEGAFGWGGLLWTPLVEWRHGSGRAIFCQLVLEDQLESIPQACLLMRNLLTYACAGNPLPQRELVDDSRGLAKLEIFPTELLHRDKLWVIDPEEEKQNDPLEWQARVVNGAVLLVLPSQPGHEDWLSRLAGKPVKVREEPVYQLETCHPSDDNFLRGISPFDLSLLEKVTYTPPSYQNLLIANCALDIQDVEPLLRSPHTPWEDYFIHGLDGEPIKMAIATRKHLQDPDSNRRVYAALMNLGKGRIIFCQVIPVAENQKIRRFYSRFLANLGADIRTDLFSRQLQVTDFGIEAVMGLERGEHQLEEAMIEYFTDPDYVLNNLGEGVYGWMVRLEKRGGKINIPVTSRRTCFLTVFVESEINRDPSRRLSNILPDSSIVPDLYIDLNCAFQLFINGVASLTSSDVPASVLKAEDIPLREGTNRLVLICQPVGEEIWLNAWFLNKFREPLHDLRYRLTLD